MKTLYLPSNNNAGLLRQPSLLLCVLLDFIGYASYSLPLLGEIADIVWAPISALLFFAMFGGWRGGVGSIFSFVEEILPGTDFIPSFTIMWLMRNAQNKQRKGQKINP